MKSVNEFNFLCIFFIILSLMLGLYCGYRIGDREGQAYILKATETKYVMTFDLNNERSLHLLLKDGTTVSLKTKGEK
jgi:membrane protein DedA with SNARE-associated domain